jgi:hypothetical protein
LTSTYGSTLLTEKEELNKIIDQAYFSRCSDRKISEECSIKFLIIFVEAKKGLGFSSRNIYNDYGLEFILDYYEHIKRVHVNESTIYDLRLLELMRNLGLLKYEERDFWIDKIVWADLDRQNAENAVKFLDIKQLQILFLRILKINNVEDLKQVDVNFTLAKENVCRQIPTLDELRENSPCDAFNWIKVACFCNTRPVTRDKELIKLLLEKNYDNPHEEHCAWHIRNLDIYYEQCLHFI